MLLLTVIRYIMLLAPNLYNPRTPHISDEPKPNNIYRTAATPAATAPARSKPFLTTLVSAPFPEVLALALDPVALALPLALPDPELVGLLLPEEPLPLLLLLLAAPKTPPWAVLGDEPCASLAADLYASRVFSLDLSSSKSAAVEKPELLRLCTDGGQLTEDSPPSPYPLHNGPWPSSTTKEDRCC